MKPECNYSKHAPKLHLKYLWCNGLRGECLRYSQSAVLMFLRVQSATFKAIWKIGMKEFKPQKLTSGLLGFTPLSSTINTLKLQGEYITVKD